MIKTDNNSGFKWYSNHNIRIKGSFFDKNNNYYEKENLLKYFENIENKENFIKKVKNINGIFSVIIENKNTIFAASDIIRMFPIFYTIAENNFVISDKIKNVKNGAKSEIAIAEILACGFVTRKNTIYKQTKQIQAGELIIYENGKIENITYQNYFTTESNILNNSTEELENKANIIFNNVANRLIKSLNNRTAIIPLSGGYDSRLIAVMLKNAGYKKVICYTYGKNTAKDIPISKKVAEKLGFEWHYIEYNNELFGEFLSDDIFQKYWKYTSQEVTYPFFQEYFAVKYLKENNIIPENSIFISGHSGDFIGGSHLKNYFLKTKNNFSEVIFSTHFNLNKINFEYKKQIRKKIYEYYSKIINNEKGIKIYSIIEDFNFKERQSKAITNSANVYNFFGYEHRLPFWDKELVDLFKTVPFEQRLYKKLYNRVLNNYYFLKYNLNFEEELQPTEREVKLQIIKNKIKKYLPIFYKKKLLKKHNWLNTEQIIKELKKDYNNFDYNILSYNSLIIQWFVNRLK